YAAAGVFEARQALQLVQARAGAMSAACASVDGSMAAVIGLDEVPLRAACLAATQNGSSVEVANLNAPGNLIVSGARDALERVGGTARAAGARRVLPLNVGGPFHSVYMRPAAEAVSQAVEREVFAAARVPVILNATAEATQDVDTL